jgi:hypothetical protein
MDVEHFLCVACIASVNDVVAFIVVFFNVFIIIIFYYYKIISCVHVEFLSV